MEKIEANFLQEVLTRPVDNNFYNKIVKILEHPNCGRMVKIKFAFHCAKDLDKYYDTEKYSEIKKAIDKCLELLADYILEPKESKLKEIRSAASATYAAANAAANAADNAVYAAASAAYAAYAAANAANAAANAAPAAANAAANAAASATYAAAPAAPAAANAAANAAPAAANAANYKYLVSLIIEEYNLNENTISILYKDVKDFNERV